MYAKTFIKRPISAASTYLHSGNAIRANKNIRAYLYYRITPGSIHKTISVDTMTEKVILKLPRGLDFFFTMMAEFIRESDILYGQLKNTFIDYDFIKKQINKRHARKMDMPYHAMAQMFKDKGFDDYPDRLKGFVKKEKEGGKI